MKFNNIIHESQLSDKKFPVMAPEPEREAKLIVLQPVGYPFVCNLMEAPRIDVVNKELFELYARDQWEGFTAREGSYLFDQKLLPDYAFKKIGRAHV